MSSYSKGSAGKNAVNPSCLFTRIDELNFCLNVVFFLVVHMNQFSNTHNFLKYYHVTFTN